MTQTIYGDAVHTPDLNNSLFPPSGDVTDLYHIGTDGKYVAKKTSLTISAPHGWAFIGNPYPWVVDIHTNADSAASAEWNQLDRLEKTSPDRFIITSKGPNRITADVISGSHSMLICIACLAEKV